MPLEDPVVLQDKNRKRLRDVINSTFALGINVTTPSKFKDSLRIISIILIIISWGDVYGHIAFIKRYMKNIPIISESICTLLQTLISIFKLNYMIFVQHRFYKILNEVQTHELVDKLKFLANKTPYNKELRKDAIKILDRCWTNAKRQFYFYMFACCTIISFYFFRALTLNKYNEIIGTSNYTNILAFPTLFPFWEDKMNRFPYYQLLTLVVGTGDYISGICALSFDGIFIFLALHGVALFQILKKMIIFTTSPIVPKELRLGYLHECVMHYERTYQFCVELNNLYLHLSLVQFLLSLVTLGVVMFQASWGLEDDIKIFIRMVIFISAAGYEVLIYCLNGQFLTNESESLPFAWYDCEWYNESREFKLLIKMLIMRSNRVMYMRASWFTTMSLETLLSILNTSGSYFLLLRNLAF